MSVYPVTEHLARFVRDTTLPKVPFAAVATAKIAVMDSLGVALAGSQDEAGNLAAHIVREENAREQASVLGHGFQTSAQQAAFANGIATHALDYDHGLASGGQPTAPIIAAALALSESVNTSGAKLLEAYIIGFEVTAKISQSLYSVIQHGWHAPGNMGILGATAACAKVLDLSLDQTRYALGMAVSMAGGVEANFGTMTKSLHVGHAARNAVLATKLSAAGFTANVEAIEAGTGYYDAYYRTTPGDNTPLAGLGESWELVESGLKVKPYPCGGLAHTAIDAAVALRQEQITAVGRGFTAESIESVHVEVTARTFARIIFGAPRTELEAKFSMPYLIARALVDGRVGLGAFTDESIHDPIVLAVAAKVTMHLGADLTPNQSGRPARVQIHLTGGQTLNKQVDSPKGGDIVPMTTEELLTKFNECAIHVIGAKPAGQLAREIGRLDAAPDLRSLTTLLRGPAER
jgi:2-methylcitrate dehydratase PrpD